MKRILEEELVQWKDRKTDRMPLALNGARQVGKTYLLQEFGVRDLKIRFILILNECQWWQNILMEI